MEKQEYKKVRIIKNSPKQEIDSNIDHLIGKEFEISNYGKEYEYGLYIKTDSYPEYFIFKDEFEFIPNKINEKTYKTWEVIKMLTENSKLKFKRVTDNPNNKLDLYSISKGNGNAISWMSMAQIDICVEDEWEISEKLVDFIDTVKSFKSGKTIRCDFNGWSYTYKPDGNAKELIDGNNQPVSTDEILNGKWYIEY